MYYRLKIISSSQRDRIGDFFLNGLRPLNIGQTGSCEVKLPDTDDYEPSVLATILPGEDGKSWYIVRRCDDFSVMVNGEEVAIARTLHNDDTITITCGNQEEKLKFEVFENGEYNPTNGTLFIKHSPRSRKALAAGMAAMFVIIIISQILLSSREDDIRHSDLSRLSESVYTITVDSVYLLCDTTINGVREMKVIDAVELTDVASGTAFLTDSGLFVTARHCVEPWINDEEWDGVAADDKMSPEVRLATFAETENRYALRQKYILKSHCIISQGQNRQHFYSTDFHMNKTRDMVLRLGTEHTPIYWRTIFPIAHRRDMELGDFAYIEAEGIKGNISLAGFDEIKYFSSPEVIHEIAVIGYPLNDNDALSRAVTVFGDLMSVDFDDSIKSIAGCMQMSASINRGNSGGPVLAKIGNDIKAIGIVSKADSRADQGMFWAVPVTEVSSMRHNHDNPPTENIIFRR